jgi:hypothetical protein
MKYIDESDKGMVETLQRASGLDEAMFFQRRRRRIDATKDFQRSFATKNQWSRDRWAIMSGIRKFHRSIGGRKFHRTLGDWLARRTFNDRWSATDERYDLIKCLSSFMTQLTIMNEYYRDDGESANLELLIESVSKELCGIIMRCVDHAELNESDLGYLVLICEDTALIQSLADQSGKSVDDVEKLWNQAKESVKKEYKIEPDSERFYALVVGTLKKMLGISEK